MFSSSTMHMDPDTPEGHLLRGWYDSIGVNESYQAYSNNGAGMSSSYATFDRVEILPLNDVKERELGMSDKPDSFSARATVMHIKPDNLAYPACQSQGCNKKVIEDHDGTWRCEKCNKTWDKPEYRCGAVAAVVRWCTLIQIHRCIITIATGTLSRWQWRTILARHGYRALTTSAR